MNTITFPGYNLNLSISRTAFSIGSVDIYWYAILMTLSFVIAMIIYKLKDKTYDLKFDNITSARIYYILFKLDYYIQYPIEMFNFRNGGLAIYGGIIGGAITCYIYCKIKKIDFINLLDYIVVCLPLRTSNRKMG